ncbi:MAG: Cys-Gln thioester bond-forming surface protein [Clostridia bacterium]|nr:Cys-Gln thioester bond-forming surface protein [Clostridia bacterium]
MKKLTKLFSLILMLCILLSTAAVSVSAAEIIDGNTWYGDEVSVDVVAGTEGYNYMSLFRKPIHGYEFSGHYVGGTESPQTFVIIDSAKYDGTTWTPNGVYEFGESNYDVTYCCDIETMVQDGIYYKRVNLDDSEYYTPEQAKKIRAIVSNAYPYVSLEEMKASLAENGFEYAEEMTRGEIISAVQAAIWASANDKPADELRYDRTYRVTDNFQWGQPVHDISDEAGFSVKGKRVFAVYEDVRVRHDALVDYLLALPGVEADNGQIVITQLDILNCKVDNTENLYEVTINVALNQGADENDDVVINAYLNGENIYSVQVGEASNYSVEFNALEDSNIQVVVSGTQKLERGVYFYAPEPADTNGDGIATSREVSQNFVGVAAGETAVYADAKLTFHDGVLEAKKLSNNKNNSRFEVSVEVPGRIDKTARDETEASGDSSTESSENSSSTMYFNVTVTDYMSKWALLCPETIKVVDEALGIVIWSAKDGWLIDENRPTQQEVPVLVEVVDPKDYAAGGEDVIGNKNGDVFVLTWYVKDGPLLRSDNYKLVYEVELDVDEEGFAFGSPYPTNGKTEIDYNGNQTTVIEPPEAKTPDLISVEFSGVKYLDDRLAAGFTFCLKDSEGNIIGEAISKEDGSFSFEPVEFTKQGVYTFTVSEAIGDEAVYTYDKTVYEITVVVSGDEEKLTAEVSGAAEIEFRNETVPVPGDSSEMIIFVILAIASVTIAFKLKKENKPQL